MNRSLETAILALFPQHAIAVAGHDKRRTTFALRVECVYHRTFGPISCTHVLLLKSGSCKIVHQACWTDRKNQCRLPAHPNLRILVWTVDLHRPSSTARLNAAPSPGSYSFESPSQTRLCIVAPLTQLSKDTRTLNLAAKRLYSPLDTVAFLDRDLSHTARLYAPNPRLLNPPKKRPAEGPGRIFQSCQHP